MPASRRAVLALALLAGAAGAGPALADGGTGGGSGTILGGTAGTDSVEAAGGSGGDSSLQPGGGGGGGGAGVTGGAGGTAVGGTGNAPGGPGGQTPGAAGQGGTPGLPPDGINNIVGSGGGGGGGGAHGFVGAVLPTTAVVGGSGGTGGAGGSFNLDGGGGGAGGYGAVLTGTGALGTLGVTVTGGRGGDGGAAGLNGLDGGGGSGGIGLWLGGDAEITVNAGITGGAGGNIAGDSTSEPGRGGTGVVISSGSMLTNNATVSGGAGGGSTGFVEAANGGSGVTVAAGATLINNGTISGGTGGGNADFIAANGGTGVIGTAGATLINTGTITGGAGGTGGFFDGDGGDGVSGSGLTIINSGTIQAGGDNSVAVRFTSGSNRLELRAGSNITGGVRANTGSTFALGGAVDASFNVSQIGGSSQYRGFTAFEKTGTSSWTLTGTTATTTSWRLLEGTLSVSSDSNLGAPAGTLTFDGGSLAITGTGFTSTSRTIDWGANGGGFDIVDAAATFTLAQGLAGGPLTKAGAGTLAITGANTYTGGTTIAAGTLQLGDGGAGGSIVGDVVDNGRLAFNRSDLVTFDGAITGGGAVAQVGTGTTVLTAANSYGGGTTIDAGTLIGTAASFGTGTILDNAALVIDQPGDATMGNAIDGTGSLTKRGAGALVLTGTSTLSGATLVEAGRLTVNGSLASSIVTLADGTILGGNGRIGGLVLQGGAIVAPGNSIGVLTIAGNVTFATGAAYQVEISAAGAADRIVASGAATLAGATVQVLAAPGAFAPSTRYTILTAASISGQFGPVTSNLAFLTPSLGYDATAVYLTVQRNDLRFADIGVTPNQTATGAGVEGLGSGNPLYDAAAGLDVASARTAFDALSGELHATLRGRLLEDSRFVREATLDRVRQAFGGAARGTQAAPAGAAVTGWIRSFGSWADFGNDGNAAGADRSTSGILVGADATVDDTWRVGVATGYSHTVLSVPARGSTARVDSYHLAIYGGTRFGALGLSAGAAYAWHDVNTSRGIAFPGFADRTRDSYGARTAQVYGEAGYTVNLGPAAVEPFGNVAWVGLHTDRVRETGGSAALRGGSDSQQATFTTLGVRAQAGFDFAGGHRMMLQGMAGWRHTFGDVTPGAALALGGGGPGFTVAGAPIARNALVLEAGVDVFLTETISAGVRYDGQIASSVRDHGFRANLTIRF